MTNLSFRVNPEEHAAILYRMKQARAKDLSAYLRQACVTGGYDIDSHLGRMQREINMLTEQVEQQQKLIKQLLAKDKDLDLQLLAGIYKMLHMAVEPDVRAVMAQDIDFKGVDAFLRGERKDAGSGTNPAPESSHEPPKPKNAYQAARESIKAKLGRR